MTGGSAIRHVLPGLRPEPLAGYLAGLGLIRLIGEQVDPTATAAWSPVGLTITTDVVDLAEWLADAYVPTPVVSPWNGGSGFGPKDKEPKRRLDDLRAHPSPRLAHFRPVLSVAAKIGADFREKGWDKARAVREFRNWCPDSLLPWVDATVVLAGADTFFPPLLGTGGNDGRLDFSTTFHQRLLDLFDPTDKGRARSIAYAQDLLSGSESQRLMSAPIGQFDPGAAGGPGSSRFGAAESLVNPWAYVLLVEGALLFAASANRRHQHDAGRAAIPFTVHSSADGSASGADGEESRGEIWAPVWKRDFTLAEIRQLFAEARAHWRGRPALRAADFYAATRTLGVARGVDRFIRYGIHRRNGLAFAAVPIDRVDVRDKPQVRLAGRLEDWVSRVRSAEGSAAVKQAVRRYDAAFLAYAKDGEADTLMRLLAALTALEQAVGRSGRAKEKVPVRRWLPSAGDFLDLLAHRECREMRVAVGIASCALTGPDRDRAQGRTMRQILLPIDPPDGNRPGAAGRWRDAPLVGGFRVRPLRRVLADVLVWRSRNFADETRGRFRGVPTFRRGVPVPAADLHALALGQLDDAALELWLAACLALDWHNVSYRWKVTDPVIPLPTLGLLHPFALGLAPERAGESAPMRALRPDWPNRLTAGQIRAVHDEAAATLRQCGRRAAPLPPEPADRAIDGVLLTAALIPRCRSADADAVLRRLTVPLRTESDDADGPPPFEGNAIPPGAVTTILAANSTDAVPPQPSQPT